MGQGAQISAMGARSYADGMNLYGDRVQAGLQFGAAQSAWVDRANYANAAAGTLAAYGVQPGTISAGSKPDDWKGGAWMGQLGAAAREEAQYAAPGSIYFQSIANGMGYLNTNYGVGAMRSAYDLNKLDPAAAYGAASVMFAGYVAAGSSWNQLTDQQRTDIVSGPVPKFIQPKIPSLQGK